MCFFWLCPQNRKTNIKQLNTSLLYVGEERRVGGRERKRRKKWTLESHGARHPDTLYIHTKEDNARSQSSLSTKSMTEAPAKARFCNKILKNHLEWPCIFGVTSLKVTSLRVTGLLIKFFAKFLLIAICNHNRISILQFHCNVSVCYWPISDMNSNLYSVAIFFCHSQELFIVSTTISL